MEKVKIYWIQEVELFSASTLSGYHRHKLRHLKTISTSVILILKLTVRPRSHFSRSQKHPSVVCLLRFSHWFRPFNSNASPPTGPGTRVGDPNTVKFQTGVCSMVPTILTNVIRCTWISVSIDEIRNTNVKKLDFSERGNEYKHESKANTSCITVTCLLKD